MMRQYCKTKEDYQDALLMFRVGDFYELYFEDAVTASNELDIILTGRDCGLESRVPMAGVPFHSVEGYIAKLIGKGYKVAICEQTSTTAGVGGLFEREVLRVITPGTVVDSALLDEEKNNYIASIYYDGGAAGVAWSDISTGEFNHAPICAPIAVPLGELLTKIAPAEIICNAAMLEASVTLSIVKYGMVCPFSLYKEPAFDSANALQSILGQFAPDTANALKKKPHCLCASGALVEYLSETQKRKLSHIRTSLAAAPGKNMYIDAAARKALELVESAVECDKRGSLLWLIDKTCTKPGARALRKTVLEPMLDETQINCSLEAVEELLSDRMRDKLKTTLKNTADIERIVGKLSYGNLSPREALRLGQSLSLIPDLKAALGKTKSQALSDIDARLIDYPEIYSEVIAAISEKAPMLIRDGGAIREGYDARLDECRNLQKNTAGVIADLEAAERAETGLKSLRISYTRNFGYYIELPRSQAELVPFRYIRRQTLKNAERYMTEELKLLEDKVLNAAENALLREEELYKILLEKLSAFIDAFLALSHAIAELDVLVSHAEASKECRFCRPQIGEGIHKLAITEGRHPVVEKLLKSEPFVPNDCLLDEGENRIMLITGPNMAGKSVYMRTAAIITILAHIGCFVPAKSAQIPITDKIFTRVGASDDLLTGRSTFMMEMSEVSSILSTMSDKSLLLLDEIGRGTSTYDGLSIAWSVLEYIAARSKAKVLFSTHYHELTELEGVLPGLKNYKLTLREAGGSIVFLRKLLRGCANRSFGIEVASLAGLPPEIVSRAKELLKQLEAADIGRQAKMAQSHQISIFSSASRDEIQTILRELDLDAVSPRNALDILTDLKEKAEKQNG